MAVKEAAGRTGVHGITPMAAFQLQVNPAAGMLNLKRPLLKAHITSDEGAAPCQCQARVLLQLQSSRRTYTQHR